MRDAMTWAALGAAVLIVLMMYLIDNQSCLALAEAGYPEESASYHARVCLREMLGEEVPQP